MPDNVPMNPMTVDNTPDPTPPVNSPMVVQGGGTPPPSPTPQPATVAATPAPSRTSPVHGVLSGIVLGALAGAAHGLQKTAKGVGPTLGKMGDVYDVNTGQPTRQQRAIAVQKSQQELDAARQKQQIEKQNAAAQQTKDMDEHQKAVLSNNTISMDNMHKAAENQHLEKMYPGEEESQRQTLMGQIRVQNDADRKLLSTLEEVGVHIDRSHFANGGPFDQLTKDHATQIAQGKQIALSNGEEGEKADLGFVSNDELAHTVLPHDVQVVTDWNLDPKTGVMSPVYSTLKAGQNSALDAVIAHDAGMDKFNQKQDMYSKQLADKKTQSEAVEAGAKANESNAAATKDLAEARLADIGGPAIQTAAQQLVEGNEDPSQLSKRAKSYDATLAAANDYSMRVYGKPFNIAQAQEDYKFAGQTGTQNTIKYAQALTAPGGNLDVLKGMSQRWGRTQFPEINKAQAWAQLETGNPGIAALHAQLVAVQDEYAKILSGASGGAVTSDAARQQAIDVINANLTSGQLNAVADVMRRAVGTRMKEFVGNNRYLEKQYPDLAKGPQTPAAPQIPPGKIPAYSKTTGQVIGYADDAHGTNFHKF